MSEDKLAGLKKQADKLGLKYSPNIGGSTLQERVNKAIMERAAEPVKVEATITKETDGERRARKMKEAVSLIRIQVTCFDPTMKKKAGTYIMASNSLIGTVRKFIQFGKPWMMPKILVNVMRESEYQGWVEGKTQFGITQMVSSMEKRYSITELPPITEEELAAIKKRQTVTESLRD